MVVGDVTTAVNVLVLGGGPGGYVAAIRAAQLGQSVTLVNEGPAGGTCLNSGCIPLKALVSAARRYNAICDESNAGMGIQVARPTFDWSQMQSWKQSVVERLSGGVAKLLAGNKIEIVHGSGWFLNNREMRVEGEYGSHRFAFEKCLLATGAVAVELPDLPWGNDILTPQQALALATLPASLSVVGDDYIALELATLFQSLGVGVTLLAPGERLLPAVDPAAVRLAQAGLRKLGVQVITGAQNLRREDRELVYSLNGGEKRSPLPVIVSGPLRGNTARLNLEAAGLKAGERGELAVNDRQLAREPDGGPDILAVGDMTGGPSLASVAIKQAKVAGEIMAGRKTAYLPQAVPMVAHTTPEIAWAGLTAEAARTAGYEVTTGRFPLGANGRALTLGSENGVALTVAEAGSGVLLGMTLVGPQAGDLIMEASLAIELGATLTDLAEILHPHPGLAEMPLESAEAALGLAIHTL